MWIDPYVYLVDINEFKFREGVLKILNGNEINGIMKELWNL